MAKKLKENRSAASQFRKCDKKLKGMKNSRILNQDPKTKNWYDSNHVGSYSSSRVRVSLLPLMRGVRSLFDMMVGVERRVMHAEPASVLSLMQRDESHCLAKVVVLRTENLKSGFYDAPTKNPVIRENGISGFWQGFSVSFRACEESTSTPTGTNDEYNL